ncbi:hypothetical protein M5W68_15430 [Paenibacillus larvae]|uniref:Uncharacterized protein n=3 Tax=Halcyonevirus C7Cdelta TaxID=2845733 RepID=A0A345ASG9_9CAUD|nr:hypothetical protein [Paenibacillus larvae]YP_010082179.1 protein with Ig domain [Paenibacillus phage C7Cdelta]AXF39939.1 hypothetical protein ASH_12 [Paenibacillus phage Ash]AXF40226.1 hypothetical protein LEY_12 [Paenibacillus phage Ley]AXF39773.1 hypothetical protein C7CDELTA_12 [Paenibacillus phage C7Cdelta]MCY9509979.1 hypothetical protein [Paenibacillus larvae]MCY9526468.1 hypothetical protein [Paenibacillus larvae]
MAIVNVPMGPAIVEYGTGPDKIVFDITKGGIVFTANTSTKDITVDQYGDAPVKSIIKGRTAKVTVPFAVQDLDRLAKAIPNATLITSGTGAKAKKKIEVTVSAGFDLSSTAKPLVIKPTDPNATPNDWVTIPLAAAVTDPEYTYDDDKERIVKVEFTAYVDFDKGGLLYILGDETAKPETGK